MTTGAHNDPPARRARANATSELLKTWFEDTIVSLTDENGRLYRLEEVWHRDLRAPIDTPGKL